MTKSFCGRDHKGKEWLLSMSRFRLPHRLLLIGLLLSAAAAPQRQDDPAPLPPVWVSPTPDETGAVIVIVQAGDSMWSIAARAGISLPDLLALNNLTENSIISPGDALIIGYATPEAIPPEELIPTATLPPPTPQPSATPSEAAICLSAFDDRDRNGVRGEGEPLRAAVAFTIYNTQAVVANYITDGRSEPKCVSGLSPGEYRITRSVAPGEILTTGGNWTLTLAAGSELHQAFGSFFADVQTATPASAALSGSTIQPTAPPDTPTPEPGANGISGMLPQLAGVAVLFMGGLLLLGAVLILLIRQSRNSSSDGNDGRQFRNIDDLE